MNETKIAARDALHEAIRAMQAAREADLPVDVQIELEAAAVAADQAYQAALAG